MVSLRPGRVVPRAPSFKVERVARAGRISDARPPGRRPHADVAQLVERRLPKPKVAGSRPVVRFHESPANKRVSVLGACVATSEGTTLGYQIELWSDEVDRFSDDLDQFGDSRFDLSTKETAVLAELETRQKPLACVLLDRALLQAKKIGHVWSRENVLRGQG